MADGPVAHQRRTSGTVAMVAVLVVLAGVAVAAWRIWGGGSDPFTLAYPITVPDLQPRRPYLVTPPDPLVPPTGTVVFDSSGTTNAFHDSQLLTGTEVGLLLHDGVGEVRGVMARSAGVVTGTWRFTASDRSNPDTVVRDLVALYRHGGYRPVPGAPPGVSVVVATPAAGTAGLTVYYAHYRYQQDTIRVVGYGSDHVAVTAAFDRLLDRQLTHAPAGA